jgi:hypothetical protein
MRQASTHGFWYGFNLTSAILIPCFFLLVPFLHAFEYFAQSVDINLEQQGHAVVDKETTLAVTMYNASSTPLNAAEFEINFDPKALSIQSIIPGSDLCEERFILTNNIKNTSGSASFACGTITPFSDKSGTIARIHVIPLTAGTSSIYFTASSTQVLVHDGLGTDATRERNNLVFSTL